MKLTMLIALACLLAACERSAPGTLNGMPTGGGTAGPPAPVGGGLPGTPGSPAGPGGNPAGGTGGQMGR